MKNILFLISILFLFSCEDEEDFSQPFYVDENGVTIKAKDWVTVGTTGDLNGVTYTAVDSLMLHDWIDSGKDYGKVVTTLVTRFRPMLISYLADNRGIEFPVQSITYNIETWDVSNIKIYDCPFYATVIDQDLSGWDLSNAKSLSLCADLNNVDPKIIKQDIIKDVKKNYFSLKEQILKSLEKKKLFGYIDENQWFHIGTVEDLKKFKENHCE